jgi:hypothetical protein
VGPPNRAASTDVYDAEVSHEARRGQGTVYVLRGLRSRKPPQIAPNWRTTYRLCSSALVAVVPLSISEEVLQPAHPFYLAEVVSISTGYKAGNSDSQDRSRGEMAIRFLNRGDCPGLPSEDRGHIDIGTPVVVIDFRVFVPEVVSVLSTFADPSFGSQLAQIPFVGALIGTDPPAPLPEFDLTSRTQTIRAAVDSSSIEFVQRMDSSQKDQLVKRLCTITNKANLYGTQLEAFAAGLAGAVHVTQGPPGTGKVPENS